MALVMLHLGWGWVMAKPFLCKVFLKKKKCVRSLLYEEDFSNTMSVCVTPQSQGHLHKDLFFRISNLLNVSV